MAIIQTDKGATGNPDELMALDALAHELEIKWGMDRLPGLVDAGLGAKFHQQQQLLDDAIEQGDNERIKSTALGMQRAWKALDSAATIQGALPMFQTRWQAITPQGQQVVIYRMPNAIPSPDDNGALVFCLDELLHIIDGMPELVNAVKQTFKEQGAQVTGVEKAPMDWEHGDAIPF